MKPDTEETLILLLRVAQGDPEIRRQLRAVLALPAADRDPAIRTYAEECALRGRPRDFVEAVGALCAPALAERVVVALREETGEDLLLVESEGFGCLYTLAVGLTGGLTVALLWSLLYLVRRCMDLRSLPAPLIAVVIAGSLAAGVGAALWVGRMLARWSRR